MNKTFVGVGLGAVAGVLDVIPMLLMKLPWDADLSAFSLWVVSGALLAAVDWKLHAVAKGIIVPFLVLLPTAVLIAAKEPKSLPFIAMMTLVLGAALGWSVRKFAGGERAG